MDKTTIDTSLRETLAELQVYLELQLRYNKLVLSNKLSEVSSFFVLFLVLLGLSGFLLLFGSLAFVEWISQYVTYTYLGHLIVFGFYMLLMLMLYLFRKQLIFNPVRKLFGSIFFDEEDKDINETTFSNPKTLKLQIKSEKAFLKSQEAILKEKLELLSNELTISNIFQSLAVNVYNSFVTSANVARVAYNLVKRFTFNKKSKRNSNKSGKKKLNESED
jgi:hypothetical protein